MDNEKLEDLMRNIMAECFRHGLHRFSCEEKLDSLTVELEFRWKIKGEPITENSWIPTSAKLPEESLNSVIGWDTYRKRCCFVQYLNGRFVLGNGEDIVNIVAWMPLPEPYGEEKR